MLLRSLWMPCRARQSLSLAEALPSLPRPCPPAQVSRLVTGAASEEGGIEMWALQDILQRQEERLALARSMDA